MGPRDQATVLDSLQAEVRQDDHLSVGGTAEVTMPRTYMLVHSVTEALSLGCLGHREEDFRPGSKATKSPSIEGVGDPLQRPPEGPQPVRPKHRAHAGEGQIVGCTPPGPPPTPKTRRRRLPSTVSFSSETTHLPSWPFLEPEAILG